jgi:hypothetical protein
VLIRSRSADLKGIAVTDWKANLAALVEETAAFTFTTSIPAKTLSPRIVDEPSVVQPPPTSPPLRRAGIQRGEIEQRVAQFRAHQQHLITEREEYAKSQLKRMRASLAVSEIRRLQTLPK